MRRRFLILHNPRAGLKRSPLLWRTLAALERLGCTLQIERTSSIDEDEVLAREAAAAQDFDAVVAAGGDSTIRGTAKGLMGSSLPLGIIPIGTGNVLAHEIGLRRRAGAVAAMLTRGAARQIRLGLANGEPFLLMAGVGFDAEVVKHLDHGAKQHMYKAAYAWPVLRALATPLPELSVEVDTERLSASFVVASRVSHYGGGLLLAPDAAPEREDFQVVLFQADGRIDLIRQLAALAAGKLARARGVVIRTASALRVEARGAASYQIDGEWAGETPLSLALAPQGVRLIQPLAPARRADVAERLGASEVG